MACAAVLFFAPSIGMAQQSGGFDPPQKIPEIDGMTARAALTLLTLGILVLIRPARRRVDPE